MEKWEHVVLAQILSAVENDYDSRMEYRKLGSLNVSLVGIGCNNFGWRIDAAGTQAVVDAALDAGINFFDSADVYGGGDSEAFLGAALKWRRDKAVIATKFGMKMAEGKEGAKAPYVREALDASLKRLQTDVIDLYQIHRPDSGTPIGETLQALNDAIRAGKVREIGCSNFTAEEMREARAVGVKESGWDHSSWTRRRIIHISDSKAHVDTEFTRYRKDGTVIASIESLYILTTGRWGIKMRSSFDSVIAACVMKSCCF